MIFQKIQFATPLFDEAFSLRNKILRIPLNMEFEVADIEMEWKEDHFGLYLPDQQLVACLSMRKLAGDTYKMRQVAVSKNYQGLGFGKLLVDYTEQWYRDIGAVFFELNARDIAIPFYKKMRYKTVGDPFVEVGIKHYKMQKKIG